MCRSQPGRGRWDIPRPTGVRWVAAYPPQRADGLLTLVNNNPNSVPQQLGGDEVVQAQTTCFSHPLYVSSAVVNWTVADHILHRRPRPWASSVLRFSRSASGHLHPRWYSNSRGEWTCQAGVWGHWSSCTKSHMAQRWQPRGQCLTWLTGTQKWIKFRVIWCHHMSKPPFKKRLWVYIHPFVRRLIWSLTCFCPPLRCCLVAECCLSAVLWSVIQAGTPAWRSTPEENSTESMTSGFMVSKCACVCRCDRHRLILKAKLQTQS